MVTISLPNPNDFSSAGVKGIEQFLRQLELSVHHLQKSFEQLKKDGMVNDDDTLITYRFPRVDISNREQDKEGNAKVHIDEEGDEFQSITVEIG